METELSGPDLFTHYAEQLLAEGWEEVRALGEGPLHTSSYRFEAEGSSYLGTLQVMQNGAPGRYLAQVSVFPR